MGKRVELVDVLDFFLLCGEELLTRPSVHRALKGYGGYETRRTERLLRHLEEQRLVSRTGRGLKAAYTITDEGRKQLPVLLPQNEWNLAWDGLWRVFTFDLPEVQRKQRMILWRTLHARRFGLLQRSVWVWPHDVALHLQEIVEVTGIPECFCGFESRRLFLCTDAEVVASAWSWEEIQRRHRGHLQHSVATVENVRNATDWAGLARLARVERQSYEFAFVFDPLLPRCLWPSDYLGEKVQERHESFREELRRRMAVVSFS